LIADDVEDNRDLYATYFESSGFDVYRASDGEEVLACIARRKPDVVVLDLSMPNIDGWEATRLIKANAQTRDVLVVVVTGRATHDDLTRARAVGADEVLTKPCLPQELLARVTALLRGE
jgi:CheY-like chemotaxis protein